MTININTHDLAHDLKIDLRDLAALRQGIEDGHEQGFELSMGMTYDDIDAQWAYDIGTHIGACLAVRPKDHEVTENSRDDAWAVEMCDRAGIGLVEAEEEEIRGRWDWLGKGCASDASLDGMGEAALDAIDHFWPRADWQCETQNGNTKLGYREWVEHKIEAGD